MAASQGLPLFSESQFFEHFGRYENSTLELPGVKRIESGTIYNRVTSR